METIYNPFLSSRSTWKHVLFSFAERKPHFSQRNPLFFPIDFSVLPHFGHGGFLHVILGASFMTCNFSRFMVIPCLCEEGRTPP